MRALTDRIVRACDPDSVILFGSQAKGMQNIDSDVDILVVGDFAGAPSLRSRELQQLLLGYPIRIDLHLRTPAELAAEARDPAGFVSRIITSGVVLYRRD